MERLRGNRRYGTSRLGVQQYQRLQNGTLVDSEQFYNISNMPPTITGGEKELATLFHALLWQARSPAVSETILFLPAIWKMLLISNSKPSHWDIAFLILCCQNTCNGSSHLCFSRQLFTLTKYSGYDPEFSYESNPTGNSYGADFGEQATLKSFIIGASINF